ncbi:MAG: hypothetical protein ACREQO_12360 [Candidatus Binatia bacterium]
MNIPFLEAPREVTFDWHIVQATKWLDFDAGRELDSVLVHTAVELRAAIERYILELLYLLKEGKLSADEEKRCRSITGIFALMKEGDPFYRRTIEFTRLVVSITPGLPEITVVDTAYLNRKWQDLSEYCHMQFRPEETFQSQGRRFQKQGFALLREVLQKFHEWRVESNCAVLARSSLPDEVRDVYDKFIREEVDANQAKRMLDLK